MKIVSHKIIAVQNFLQVLGTEIGLYVKTGQPAMCLAEVNIFSIENLGLNGIQTHIRLQSFTPPQGKINYNIYHFRSSSISRYT